MRGADILYANVPVCAQKDAETGPDADKVRSSSTVINRVRKGCAEETVLFLHVICQLHIDGFVFDET